MRKLEGGRLGARTDNGLSRLALPSRWDCLLAGVPSSQALTTRPCQIPQGSGGAQLMLPLRKSELSALQNTGPDPLGVFIYKHILRHQQSSE